MYLLDLTNIFLQISLRKTQLGNTFLFSSLNKCISNSYHVSDSILGTILLVKQTNKQTHKQKKTHNKQNLLS